MMLSPQTAVMPAFNPLAKSIPLAHMLGQYLFQGWNCRGSQKYRDMLLDIGTEEIAHVEMLATMIGYLLEGTPVSQQEAAVAADPMIAAVMGGMNPHHDEIWQVEIIKHACGRCGLITQTEAVTYYVSDLSLACPAEKFMESLCRAVAEKMLVLELLHSLVLGML